MSDVTQIVNDQRNVNETAKSFDSVESVHNRGRPPIPSNERQFVPQDPINPAARFRPGDLNQFQLWRQPPPTGRPPLAYPPPNRFASRNANEPRPFPPRNPIPPLRTQEFQNRRSFEKPERAYDIDLSPVESRLRPNSPWQRVKERLPLQSANHQSDMESTQMKINAFEDAMNREMNKDRIPPPFRRDSIVNADSRLKPQSEKRFSDEDESFRKNRPGDLPINQSNDLRKPSMVPGEFARREGAGPDPRLFDANSQHRPSLTQLQMNETNYINDRGQQNAPPKTRPLQAVPEYENRNYINRNDEERLREDQNRNHRQDSYGRDYRKLGDFENINKENRKFSNRSEDELSDETRVLTRKYSQRSFDNGRENYNNRFDGDNMNYDSVRGKNEVAFNRIGKLCSL
ncbi:uncharacterized protein LOC135844667 [Planococcus citri]|uniref:uncharacterized protein LOC135844667 n=1 Tax=Planococcus citri TaxID=170843 RepID=UPI0031F9E44D